MVTEIDKTIGILVSEYPPDPGGIGRHAYFLANGLGRSGIQVNVFSETSSLDTQKIKSPNTTLVPRKGNQFLFYLKKIFSALIWAKSQDYIVLSGRFPLLMGSVLSLCYPKKIYISFIHGSETGIKGKLVRWLIHQSWKKSKHIFCVSDYTFSQIPKKFIHKTQILYNFIDLPNPLPKLNNSGSNLNLFTLGTVSRRKGQWRVLEMMPEILKTFPHAHYHIIGMQGDGLKLCESLIQKLNLHPHVSIHGKVDETQKWELLSSMHIQLMLTQHTPNGQYEGFGISVLEAGLLGIPSIGTKNSGLSSAIQHQQTGVLVDPGNPHEIIQGISWIINHQNAISQALGVFVTEHTTDRACEKFIKIIQV